MKGEGGQSCFITSAFKLQKSKKQKYTISSDGKEKNVGCAYKKKVQ